VLKDLVDARIARLDWNGIAGRELDAFLSQSPQRPIPRVMARIIDWQGRTEGAQDRDSIEPAARIQLAQ
jgi:hypothetical protein